MSQYTPGVYLGEKQKTEKTGGSHPGGDRLKGGEIEKYV